MLISIFIVIVAVSAFYFYRKFKESENAYYELHLQYMDLMKENKILKQKIHETNDISKTSYLAKDEYLDTINENTLIMDKNVIHHLINEMPEILSNENETEQIIETVETENCEEVKNNLDNLQDINSLNYMKFKI